MAPELNSNDNANKKISHIKMEFMKASTEEIPVLLEQYSMDERSGVITVCNQYRNKAMSLQKELERLEKMKVYEQKYSNYQYICGIDEVGRGPFAGPVIAAAVILPKDCEILYINDSKQLSEKKREELYDEIIAQAIAFGIGSVPPNQIDEINILQATYEAMRKAIRNLKVNPDILLNDAVTIPGVDIRQIPIIKGDAKSVSIAAASIIAKVTRDRMMGAYHQVFPQYDFASNKGYGSAKHIEAIKQYGLTPIHRRTFVKNFITEE
ncbi:MAG: rnhB [Herbinix sp.]|nr:rnhB [Herbinix sp.]